MLDRVVFLDRDGVINRDSATYVKCVAEFEFLPGSLEAIRRLTEAGREILIVTNQSVIDRGMASLSELAEIHRYMIDTIAENGGRIRDIYFCPHLPDAGCDCRKPAPGLIRRAADAHDIDLATAVMVGDSAKDILCGRSAGCGATVLVRTGNGEAALKELAARGVSPDTLAADLLDAASWILSSRHQSVPPPKAGDSS
jgi:D-glycero-D-manno-heptose 1,7-bisphosphate phosphatase